VPLWLIRKADEGSAMTINCPQCHRKLQVPDNAIGRRARCPACRGKFVIPHPQDAMQQTIAGFVLEDLPDKGRSAPTTDTLGGNR
jgi:rRNA maturation protein Nop10